METVELKEIFRDATISKPKLFIDGEHGTTGLQIRERLAGRDDVVTLSVPVSERRNAAMRAEMLDQADVAILCLPDEASREAVSMLAQAGNDRTRLIDASTAHRIADGWTYGFAEMTSGQREAIAGARFVANPGCYSTGAIALLRPIVEAGLLPDGYPLSIHGVSGYSGGGKNLIARMEETDRDDHIAANYYLYSMQLAHKHLPEIAAHAMLARPPIFTPAVGRFERGMLVSVPIYADQLVGSPNADDLRAVIERHYRDSKTVSVADGADSDRLERVDPQEMTGTDNMKLYVFGSQDGRLAVLVASLDNLGKGASGAAVQNLDIMLGR